MSRSTDEAVDVDVEARRAIEAVVMAATEPVDPAVLAQLIELPTARIEELCDQLASEYERDGRGFVLARVAGGYRFQTHPEAAPYVERFVLDGQHARLSGPALETLAIIAYKQPISRAQLSAIRGVNVDATLRTLVARGYVEEIGHDHTPGNPALFATTDVFLERLGLDSLEQLPSLGDFVPDAGIVETLERGLRIPGEAEVVASIADDADDDADAASDDGAADVVLTDIAVEKFDVRDVEAIAAELQEGLDD
jgi:segregation and condensation protein B